MLIVEFLEFSSEAAMVVPEVAVGVIDIELEGTAKTGEHKDKNPIIKISFFIFLEDLTVMDSRLSRSMR